MQAQEKTNEQIWQEWVDQQKKLVDDAKADPANIRYYLGKYKVCIIPSQKDGLYKGYRTVAALETFPHNGVCMMLHEGDQFSCNTRHLHLKPTFDNKNSSGENKP
jgi:hypothetical protein